MSPDDALVWRPFLNSKTFPFTEPRYDVRVGNGSFHWPDDQGTPPYDWLHAAQKRIDVVATADAGTAIIEVKPIAGMAALGQVLTYVRLYRQKYKPTERLIPWVVAERIDNDVADSFNFYGVTVTLSPHLS